jgi:hypothetical protein
MCHDGCPLKMHADLGCQQLLNSQKKGDFSNYGRKAISSCTKA